MNVLIRVDLRLGNESFIVYKDKSRATLSPVSYNCITNANCLRLNDFCCNITPTFMSHHHDSSDRIDLVQITFKQFFLIT